MIRVDAVQGRLKYENIPIKSTLYYFKDDVIQKIAYSLGGRENAPARCIH